MIAAFEPIWVLTALGYLASWSGLLPAAAVGGLARFVFLLAMPAALFETMSRTSLAGFGGRPLAAFAISSVVLIGVGWLVLGRLFGRPAAERPIWGMACGYGNSANLGIPVALHILGSVSFIVQVVLLQTAILSPVILTALDRHADPAGRIRLRRIATVPVRNPVLAASVLGLVCSAAGVRVPSLIGAPLGLLSAAAVPTALVALGASLYRPEQLPDPVPEQSRDRVDEPAADPAADPAGGAVRGQWRSGAVAELSVITVLKLAGQPVLTYLIGAFLLGLDQRQLFTIVVCASLPTAQNTFIYAQQYRTAQALAGRAVLITTTLSLVTLATAAALLR